MLRRLSRRLTVLGVGTVAALGLFALVVLPIQGVGSATLSIPHTFAPGGVIYSSQMNANFEAVRAVVNNLDTANLANNAVTTNDITDLNVTTAKLADSAVTSVKIADLGIATGDIADLAITAAKLADTAITSAKIPDGTVATVDLADDAVSGAKLDFGAGNPGIGIDDYMVGWDSSALKFAMRKPCAPVIAVETYTYDGTTRYIDLSDFAAINATETNVDHFVAPRNLWITDLRVLTHSGGIATTATIREDGVDTALGCVTSANVCTDTDLDVVDGGDKLTVSVAAANSGGVTHTITVSFCVFSSE